MRSRTGCLTCRQRKLKCDERKPVCGPCSKASRDCRFGSSIIFRHQQNASMNGTGEPDETNLKSFFAYKNTFDADTVWLDIPRQVTFWNTTDPYNEPMSPNHEGPPSSTPTTSQTPSQPVATVEWNGQDSYRQPDATSAAHGLHALSAAAAGDHFSFFARDSAQTATPGSDNALLSGGNSSAMQVPTPLARRSIDSPMSPPVSMTSSNHNIDFILNHPAAASPTLDPTLQSPFASGSRERFQPRPTSSHTSATATSNPFEHNAETDHEIAYLLRYFSEGPGQWMDLYDLGSYFGSYVPVKAQANPVLKHAAAAYAAKALGRVRGKKPRCGGNAFRPARMELYPNAGAVDWYHKAAEYYDNAVSLLRQALQDDARGMSQEATVPDTNWQQQQVEGQADGEGGTYKRRRLSSIPISRCNSDELLAATAILCVYEFLDGSGHEWSRHLNGAKSLIDIAKDSMMPLQLPSPGATLLHQSAKLSKARKATFWNIARQDMLSAFINASHTRLDPEDLPMWKDAGLLIDASGFVILPDSASTGYPEREDTMKEDMIANALVWLMAKLVNFMAAGDEIPASVSVGSPYPTGVPQRTLLDYWLYLKQQFQNWYDRLPVTFKPCARIPPSRIPAQLIEDESDAVFPEVWYSLPMCGSTMQAYHMSQVQLLMNKPHETTQGRTTVFARFNSYEAAISECQKHSREIVSIALGRPDNAVRINSVQPLYTAGQCLAERRERRVVSRLLREVERDTGWATEYRRRQLFEQWGEGDEAVG